jgi:hypothetical protein
MFPSVRLGTQRVRASLHSFTVPADQFLPPSGDGWLPVAAVYPVADPRVNLSAWINPTSCGFACSALPAAPGQPRHRHHCGQNSPTTPACRPRSAPAASVRTKLRGGSRPARRASAGHHSGPAAAASAGLFAAGYELNICNPGPGPGPRGVSTTGCASAATTSPPTPATSGHQDRDHLRSALKRLGSEMRPTSNPTSPS